MNIKLEQISIGTGAISTVILKHFQKFGADKYVKPETDSMNKLFNPEQLLEAAQLGSGGYSPAINKKLMSVA